MQNGGIRLFGAPVIHQLTPSAAIGGIQASWFEGLGRGFQFHHVTPAAVVTTQSIQQFQFNALGREFEFFQITPVEVVTPPAPSGGGGGKQYRPQFEADKIRIDDFDLLDILYMIAKSGVLDGE